MVDTKKLAVVLVVDDEPAVLETFESILEGKFTVLTARGGVEALERVTKESINLVFLDITMPDMDGIRVLRKIKEYDENLAVIMATATDSARKAVEAMQLGACNYITKPFDAREVLAAAEKALAQEKLRKEVIYLRSQKEEIKFDNIIGKSKKIREIYKIIEKVAENDATVLISGESGTGKELIARAIHFNSTRREKPFIPINCASIPENLLESELFGHEKGAFTDAINQKLGMFELADEGTLFLDEISGLRFDVQSNLLRALEEKEVRRLGGTKLIKVDVRILSATNVDLKQAVQEGKFRQDLYYRLNVVPIYLAPLRERKEDIPVLVDHFLKRYNQVFRKKIEGLTQEALECLMSYEWPGNIRELKNVIERLAALKDDGIITHKDLPFDIFVNSSLAKNFKAEGGLKEAGKDFEKKYIEAVLERVGGNKTKAAKILGIHRNALFNKMKSWA
ncbi:MAG: sigma-54 dependent transcriptional regulator [Candidatus Omnitrophica bacterium]|nr:sigma-54 dependent transcriptional regulator [Candidatus Omnitrophota bacterium]